MKAPHALKRPGTIVVEPKKAAAKHASLRVGRAVRADQHDPGKAGQGGGSHQRAGPDSPYG